MVTRKHTSHTVELSHPFIETLNVSHTCMTLPYQLAAQLKAFRGMLRYLADDARKRTSKRRILVEPVSINPPFMWTGSDAEAHVHMVCIKYCKIPIKRPQNILAVLSKSPFTNVSCIIPNVDRYFTVGCKLYSRYT